MAKHVILVDWDGFSPDYLGRVPTPNLDDLRDRGSMTISEATFHTISTPIRGSMSTGTYPEIHGNVGYVYDPVTNTARSNGRYLAAETIAQSVADSGLTLASVQWYIVHNYGATYGDAKHLYVQPGGTFDRRVDAAIEILHQRPVDSFGQAVTVPKIPDFLAVYSADLDHLGHKEGPGSANMAPLLAEHDRQLGRLIQATRDVGIYSDTAFVLTSDHGMTGWNRTLAPIVPEAIADLGFRVEIVRPGESATPDAEVIIVPTSVRLGDITLRGRADSPAAGQQIAAALRQLPEIGRVHTSDDLVRLRASGRLGDLVVEPEPPWGFARPERVSGQWRGSHGSLREMNVPLFLAGADISRGAEPHHPRVVDVAPTIAALLWVRPPAHAQGRVLSESLSR